MIESMALCCYQVH